MIPTTVTSSSPSTASSSSSNIAISNNSNTGSNIQQQQQQQQQTPMTTTAAATPHNSPTAMLGIAALILEGRAIAEDEYHQPQAAAAASAARVPAEALESFFGSAGGGTNSVFAAGAANYQVGGGAAGRQSPKPSTSRAAFGSSSGGSSSIGSSSASASAGGGHIINITTNPHAFGGLGSAAAGACAATPLFIDHYNSSSSAAAGGGGGGGGGGSASSSSSSTSAESMHMRWTQKLCALRQASPTASISTAYKQKVAVESAQSAGEPELVALAINEHSGAERGSNSGGGGSGGGDFEIVRRVILQRHANMGSGSSGIASVAANATCGSSASTSPVAASAAIGAVGSADNFLHSLQSLATTCLRGSSPSASPLAPQVGATATAAASAPQTSPKYHTYRASAATPPPARFQSPGAYTSMDISGGGVCGGSASSSGSGVQSPRTAWSPVGVSSNVAASSSSGSSSQQNRHQKEKFLRHTSAIRMPIPATVTSAAAAAAAAASANASAAIPNQASTKGAAAAAVRAAAAAPAQTTTPAATPPSTPTTRYPQQGPHCDQFLRKLGLAKGESADAEDHFCDMSYVNITCSRWRVYCLKMEAIIASGVPVCIEVYLGPMSHKILLEQWIITQKEKVPPPTMTLPSLCSAIRSQLYFSQISAWCDLIKKSDKTIYDTGRIIFPTTAATAAGDLATSSVANNAPNLSAPAGGTMLPNQTVGAAVSSSSGTAVASPLNQHALHLNNRRPRLNIFYRIKPYDSTACFNSKPNVHNFPNVNITENCSITVCLKSLPRINGGIPNCGAAGVVVGPANAPATATAMPTTAGGSGHGHGTNGASSKIAASFENGASAAISASTNLAAVVETPRSSRTLIGTLPPVVTTPLNCDKSNRTSMRAALNCYAPLAPLIMPPVAAATADILTTLSAATTHAAAAAGANGAAKQPKCMFFIDEEELQEAAEQQPAPGACTKEHNDEEAQEADDNDVDDDDDYEEDEEDDDDESTSDLAAGTAGDSSNSSFSSCTNSNNLSHRERQLMKYRKRMQKRDKKRVGAGGVGCGVSGGGNKQTTTTTVLSNASDDASCELSTAELVAYHQPTAMVRNQRSSSSCNNNNSSSSVNCCQPMEQGDEEQDEEEEQTLVEADATAATARRIEMISTGTQTPLTSCQQCGSIKTLICLKCSSSGGAGSSNGAVGCHNLNAAAEKIDPDEMDDSTSTSSSISSSDIIHTPRNKAELLLQAIQRTPKAAKKHKKQTLRAAAASAAASCSAAAATTLQNNNHLSELPALVAMSMTAASSAITNGGGSCQVCKRQKTQHNFSAAAARRRANESATSTSGVDESADALASAAYGGAGVGEEQQDDGGESAEAAGKATGSSSINNNSSRQHEDGGDQVDDVFKRTLFPAHMKKPPRPFSRKHSQLAAVVSVSVPRVQTMDEHKESYLSSTRLTPHIERCTLSASSSTANLRCGAAGDHNRHSAARREHFLRSCTPPTMEQRRRQLKPDDATTTTKTMAAASTSDVDGGAQFKTPTNMPQQQQQLAPPPFQQHQQTPKPNLLLLTSSCNYHRSCGGGGDGQQAASNGVGAGLAVSAPAPMYETITPTTHLGGCALDSVPAGAGAHNPLLLLRKALPKVNLTPLFCSPQTAQMAISCPTTNAAAAAARLSAPIPIHSCRSAPDTSAAALTTFCFDSSSLTATIGGGGTGGGVDNCVACIPVQKSYSAPTLPNSPSLSPRFAKQAAIYKRRSRHLSDRSDRSSLGSDELLSDEDLESGAGSLYSGGIGSPATSPLKQRARIAAAFGRLPLLGNLEESLLQRRLVPKIEVMGFKVLLGASGGFCPTQLTIPAAAFFYELHGEALSTPYVCDIRLPRKGYSVPRAGTVQATLLNPMGTVVRMFVIPYDMRDMPPLHQTFIRQRVLAEASTNEKTATLQIAGGSNLNGAGPGQLNGFGGGSNNNNKYRLSPSGGLHGESNLGHFISAEHMKRLRYSIHLRFQTSRSGRLTLHTDIRLLISRRTDCDTAAAHAKGVLEAPNDLVTDTVMPTNPKYSARQEPPNRI